MQNNQNVASNSSFSKYRTKELNSTSSDDSENFKDADEDINIDVMSGNDDKNGPEAGTNSKNVSAESDTTSVTETEVKTLASDIIYPKAEHTTDEDLVLLNALPQISAVSKIKVNSIKRADHKPEDTLKIFRALNDNPTEVGFDVKNYTDLPVNHVTLKKAIRVGNLEKTITDIRDSMSKMLTNSQNALKIAEDSKNVADQALKAVSRR